MSPQRSAEPLTFQGALDQRCPLCELPWTMHRLWSFAAIRTGPASASLEFTVDCPTPQAQL
jgi:hypothetical protein